MYHERMDKRKDLYGRSIDSIRAVNAPFGFINLSYNITYIL